MLEMVMVRLILILPAAFGTHYMADQKKAMFPLIWLPVLLVYEGLLIMFYTLPAEGWAFRVAAWTMLLSCGVAVSWDLFVTPRWYYLKGFSFHRDITSYNALAMTLRTLLMKHGCEPWQGVLLPQGLLGLAHTDEPFEEAINDAIQELDGFENAQRRFCLYVCGTFVVVLSVSVFSTLGYIV